jgi:hypothetical protein
MIRSPGSDPFFCKTGGISIGKVEGVRIEEDSVRPGAETKRQAIFESWGEEIQMRR